MIALLSVSAAAGVGAGYPISGLIADALGLSGAFWSGHRQRGALICVSPLSPPAGRTPGAARCSGRPPAGRRTPPSSRARRRPWDGNERAGQQEGARYIEPRQAVRPAGGDNGDHADQRPGADDGPEPEGAR